MRYFAADHHFHHVNKKGEGIIDYCQRPFANIEEMHWQMIERHNERVSHKDKVYILGDFALARADDAENLLKQLRGRIKIVPGGHDFRWLKEMGFKVNRGDTGTLLAPLNHVEILPALFNLRLNRNLGVPRTIVLCHYPLFTWQESHHGSWHLHGHSHGGLGRGNRFQKIVKLPPSTLEDGHSMDVGVDAWDFYPVSLTEVVKRLGDE